MFCIHIYLEASSRYLGARERWGGYVIAYKRQNGELLTVEGCQKVKGTYNHVLLHLLNTALMRVKKPSEIHICTENGYLLDMIRFRLLDWAGKGFTGGKGRPVKDAAEWETLWKLSKGHKLVPEYGIHEFSHRQKEEFLRLEREKEDCG